ncbi:MAG TPA: hypothetical protein VMW18_15715 [Candidatus Binatia bacterium]|nr:hypothetical protein [Candidatus Binatia bacterium]
MKLLGTLRDPVAPESLDARIAALTTRLAELDRDRGLLSLAAVEGDAAAEKVLSKLDKDRMALAAELDRLRSAQLHAADRARLEADDAAARARDARLAEIRAEAVALRDKVEAIDELVERLADALLALKQGQNAMSLACGGIPANGPLASFANRLPVNICTALAFRGFHFQSDPFAVRDADGRPDLEALKLTPHYPGADYFAALVANNA